MAEKEYIEREALVERLKKEECDCEWLWTILDIPAADVAPVVRCKDCKEFEDILCGWCNEFERPTTLDDFCSYGERKENENAEIH